MECLNKKNTLNKYHNIGHKKSRNSLICPNLTRLARNNANNMGLPRSRAATRIKKARFYNTLGMKMSPIEIKTMMILGLKKLELLRELLLSRQRGSYRLN
jgi:hypothetical protein